MTDLITRSPDICSNAWRIAGTRVTVRTIQACRECGVRWIMDEYPRLTVEHIEAALAWKKQTPAP